MHHSTSLLAAIALCAAPTGATFAATGDPDGELSYTFLEVDYVNLDIDAVDDDEGLIDDLDDGGGWGVRASFAFTPNFFAFGDYSVTDSDATFIDEEEVLLSSTQDVKRLNLGLGLNFGVDVPVVGESDVVFRAAYTDIDFDDFDFGGSDDPDLDDLNEDSSDGYFADVALRSQLAPWAEASLGVRYTDIESSDEFSVIGNVLLELTRNWGLNLEFDAGDDLGTYLIGVRYSFHRS